MPDTLADEKQGEILLIMHSAALELTQQETIPDQSS
jgi:hypothetical protein